MLLFVVKDQVLRYLVVDCRPVEQYTCGHLVGAKNLDPALVRETVARCFNQIERQTDRRTNRQMDRLLYLNSYSTNNNCYLYVCITIIVNEQNVERLCHIENHQNHT